MGAVAETSPGTQARISPTNHGAAVVLAAGIMLGVAGLALLTHLYQRWPLLRRYPWDTSINILAFIFSIGNTTAAVIAVQNGLGQHAGVVGSSRVLKSHNALVAVFATAFATQGLAAASFATLLRSMNPNKQFQKGIMITIVFAAVQSTAGVIFFSVAGVYEPSVVVKGAWIAFGTFHVCTQICLFILAIWMIWPLRMAKLRKFEVSFWFLFCIPSIIATTVTRLIYTRPESFGPDFTWDNTIMVVILLVETNLTIASAACPSFRNLLTSVSTGFLVMDKSQNASRNSRSRSRSTRPKLTDSSGRYGLKSMLSGGRSRDEKRLSTVVARGDDMDTFEPYTAQVKGDANSITTFASDAVMVRRSVDVEVDIIDPPEHGHVM